MTVKEPKVKDLRGLKTPQPKHSMDVNDQRKIRHSEPDIDLKTPSKQKSNQRNTKTTKSSKKEPASKEKKKGYLSRVFRGMFSKSNEDYK